MMVKRISILAFIITLFYSCGLLINSSTEKFEIIDFGMPISKQIQFKVDSVESDLQKGVYVKGVYKAELCVSGKVDGKVSIIQFGNTYKVSEFVDECFVHEHYDDTYELEIIPENEEVTGKLTFEITLYF